MDYSESNITPRLRTRFQPTRSFSLTCQSRIFSRPVPSIYNPHPPLSTSLIGLITTVYKRLTVFIIIHNF